MSEEPEYCVRLWECCRCHLRFVDDNESIPSECPRCKRHSQIPPRIMIFGNNVLVHALRMYGERKGLMNPEIRSGLGRLNLGDRCRHGYITLLICPQCSTH